MKKLFTFLMIFTLPVVLIAQMPVFYLTFDHFDDYDFEIFDNMSEKIGIASGTIASTGQYGQGYHLNGSDSYIHFEDNVINRSSFTMTLWFSPEAADEAALMQTDGSEMEGGAVFILMYLDDGMECFVNGVDQENAFWIEPAPAAEQWMHLAMVIDVDAGTAKFYIDGELALDETAEWPNEEDKPLIGPFTIGAHTVGEARDRYWGGTVDEFRLYDEALSEEQVLETMNEIEDLSVTEIMEQSFTVFPNPSTGSIILNKNFDQVSVISNTGQELLKLNEYNSGQEIYTGHLAKGLYFIRAVDDGVESAGKFIIK